MKTLTNAFSFDLSDVAKYRHHVLMFFYSNGRRATLKAFNLKQSTLYYWKKLYEQSGRKLSSLIPMSTRPHQTRTMTTDLRLELFLKTMRQEYGNLSKYKLKPFLDEFAKSLGLASYSTGKIQKIINRRGYYFEGKLTKRKSRIKPLSSRIRRSPREKTPGYIEMDSITIYINCQKYYFITAMDIVTKFAWCKLTRSLSSQQAKIALIEFLTEYQKHHKNSILVRAIQTDNGKEFLALFHEYLLKLNISHEFIYPHSPKINAFIERFNRTIQDEFINRTDSLYYDMLVFNQKLIKYLNWYNLKRPHYSLKFMSPVEYLKVY
jgi:transposase InsO family protein